MPETVDEELAKRYNSPADVFWTLLLKQGSGSNTCWSVVYIMHFLTGNPMSSPRQYLLNMAFITAKKWRLSLIRCFMINKRIIHVHIVTTVMLFLFGFSTQTGFADVSDDSDAQPGRLIRKEVLSREDDPFDGISFPTIYKSGFDVCTNMEGKPVILLFSTASCFHCEWVGTIFDNIAMLYMEDGRIEAHHYDLQTGDDLLTEDIETQIPAVFLQIKQKGDPKDLVPYFNFSCKYERVGNGYEKEQDAEAEGQEMIDVIETLIRVLSASE